MNKGIIAIVGPTESGKTWLAMCMKNTLRHNVMIFDEPHLGFKMKQTIIEHSKNSLVIITKCSENFLVYTDFPVDKIIRLSSK